MTIDEVPEKALKKMTEETIEAMKNRNGWDTSNGIPRKLKSLAYDLWGRDPKRCVFCGSSNSLHLHHVAPEVMKYLRSYNRSRNLEDDEGNWLNPYNDTEPWQLAPLCASCHRKIENMNWTLMNRTLWWACLKKKGDYEKSLEEYLNERLSDISEHYRNPNFSEEDGIKH